MKPPRAKPIIVADVTPTLKLQFVAEEDIPLVSVVECLRRFYSLHLDASGVSRPNARILNPEWRGTRVHPHDDVWLLPYTQGYRVLVIRDDFSIYGPHAARLYYKSYTTGFLYWIATLQITEVMFFDEEKLIVKLNQAIFRKQFYIAEHSRKDVVAK